MISNRWLKKYELAKKYYEEHNNLFIPNSYICYDSLGNKIRLGNWLVNQRMAYYKKVSFSLDEEQIALLNQIGMVWDNVYSKYNEKKWMKNYKLAKKYYEEHGNLLIPAAYVAFDDEGKKVKLGFWISNQRAAYCNYGTGKISKKEIDLLNEIGMIWDARKTLCNNWDECYKLAKKYYEERKNLLVPHDYVIRLSDTETARLGQWIIDQRLDYKNNRLSSKQVELLNEIDMVWDNVIGAKNEKVISNTWLKNYEAAKKYYQKHGDLLINAKYKEVCDDGSTINLGIWINTQRRAYKNYCTNKESSHRINESKIKLLNEIGMVWSFDDFSDLKDIKWMKVYEKAKEYFSNNGDLLVNDNYTFQDEMGKKYKLINWINIQRDLYRKNLLEEDKINLLEELNIIWNPNEKKNDITDIWLNTYEEAKKYYEEHGNLLIPLTYMVKIGNKEINLGHWLSNQRYLKKHEKNNYPEKKEKMLNEIGMNWSLIKNNEFISDKWMDKYDEAKKYYLKNGNLLIPRIYMIENEGKEYNLGTWIITQRNKKIDGTLGTQKIDLLNQIGMIWDIKEYKRQLSTIDNYYSNYILGMYDSKKIDELVNVGYLKYEDDNVIKKGDINKLLERRANI